KPGATEPDGSAAPSQATLDSGTAKPASGPEEKRGEPKASAGSAQWAGQFRTKDRERSQLAAAEALKGFRDLVAEVRGEAAPSPEDPDRQPPAEPENRASRLPRPPHDP